MILVEKRARLKLGKLGRKSAKLQIFAKKESTMCTRGGAWSFAQPPCGGAWGRVRPPIGWHVVDTCVSVTSSRSISYIYTLGLGKLWEFYLGFRICALINYILVISHIGETYPEEVRGQARLGGYDPTTYL